MHLSKMMYCQNLVATIPIVALGVSLHNSFTPVPIILLRDKFPLVKVQWPPYEKTTPSLQLQAPIVAGRFEVLSDNA
jgi:hypothetical protein